MTPSRAVADARGGGRPGRQQAAGVRRVLQVILGLALAGVLLVWGLPYLAKTRWADIFAVLGGIPRDTAAAQILLVMLALSCYTFTLTASLPRLRHHQAFIVNVCGSSVSNLLPAGGAAGLAATYTICRSWGFSRAEISTSAVVTGVWNVMARIALPIIAIAGLWLGAGEVPQALQDAALAGTTGGVAILAVLLGVLGSERVALTVGMTLDASLGRLLRRRRASWSFCSVLMDQRSRIWEVVRTGWPSLTLGLGGFFGVYYVLFLLCLRGTGVEMDNGQIFAAYAIGRLLTSVAVTPGGLGVTETGTAAALVAWGASPAEAAAAVVLFTIYTHLLLVPLGALGWLVWSLTDKRGGVEVMPDAPVGHAGFPDLPADGTPTRPASRRRC